MNKKFHLQVWNQKTTEPLPQSALLFRVTFPEWMLWIAISHAEIIAGNVPASWSVEVVGDGCRLWKDGVDTSSNIVTCR